MIKQAENIRQDVQSGVVIGISLRLNFKSKKYNKTPYSNYLSSYYTESIFFSRYSLYSSKNLSFCNAGKFIHFVLPEWNLLFNKTSSGKKQYNNKQTRKVGS